MKKITIAIIISMVTWLGGYTQTDKPKKVKTNIKSEKHLSSSILLWMRKDKARKDGMERWKGPHAQIIASNKGLWEYRQLHFSDTNLGLWPVISGVQTHIPQTRKIDGVADVTLKSLFSIPKGKNPNKLAFADEINLFMRTILYASLSKNSLWYNVNESNTKIEANSMIFFRKKEGISDKDFNNFIRKELTATLANMGILKELRSKIYNPWKQKQWNTPNVLHDNKKEDQFQASLMLGFSSKNELEKFFTSEQIKKLSGRISIFCSAVHAYEISETICFIKAGKKIK